jgi:hypothetical protein
MICLCDETPVVELAGGSVALDLPWLQQSLEKAARAAGYAQWWPADDVARSVTLFLKSQRSGKPFSLGSFTSMVRRALQEIGYGEVAPFFLQDGLDLSFSLLEVAETSGTGFEMGFFHGCLEACKKMLSTGVAARLALEDLEPAVKHVLGNANWTPRCQDVADELVTFLRHHVPQHAPNHTLFFSLR